LDTKFISFKSIDVMFCDFSGEVLNPKDRCKKCQGKKVIKESKILEVKYKYLLLQTLKSNADTCNNLQAIGHLHHMYTCTLPGVKCFFGSVDWNRQSQNLPVQ